MRPIFITGIGTGVGKTIAAAVITQALQADYWKPVQAGLADGTDTLRVKELIGNPVTIIHPEAYKLALPASPHIAAKQQGVAINMATIYSHYSSLPLKNKYLVIEGAGGLMVPLNEEEFVIDLIKKMEARVVLVSRNYLGSINHSLLTAALCKQHNLNVLGWMFNDQYLNYEADIVRWSGYPAIASLPLLTMVNQQQIVRLAQLIAPSLQKFLL